MNANIKTCFAMAAFLITIPAHAYVDPGTGSIAVQMIIGGLLAAGFMLKTYYYQLRRRISRMLGRDSDAKSDADDIVANKQTTEEKNQAL